MTETHTLREDISDLRTEVSSLSKSNAKIETAVETSNLQLTEIKTDLKHAVKNFQMVSQQVSLLGEKVKDQSLKITALEEAKADREDLDEIKTKIEKNEAAVRKFGIQLLTVGGSLLAAYIANKLGIQLPGGH
jgi:chromosome segregation ATPase